MGKGVYSQWKAVAEAKGSAVVLRDPSQQKSLSFRNLQDSITEFSYKLSQSINPENRIVAFQFENSSEWLSIFLACQATRAIALPIDPDVPPDAVRAILGNLRVSAMIDPSGIRVLEKGTLRHPACLVKLTSGTTGLPKPLFFNDDQMLADGRNILHTMGITQRDSNLATIPFGHSYGLGNLVMPCVIAGCPICICRDPFPHALADSVAMANPTIYPTVPTILSSLVRSDVEAAHFESIRLWISAGSVLDAKVVREFRKKFSKAVHNFYGSSETGGIAFDKIGDCTLDGSAVGDPLQGVGAHLGAAGRLVVSSEAVYTRNNRRRNRQQGCHLLPDRAQILENGSIRLLGRTARIAKLGGKRLSLAEVENNLNALSGVRDCFVDVHVTSNDRSRLVAMVVAVTPVEDLQKALKSRLAAWKIPSRWIKLESMPVNARGKRDHAALKQILNQSLGKRGKA